MIPGNFSRNGWGGEIKENNGRGELNCDIFDLF
jgi:hypothetical protein